VTDLLSDFFGDEDIVVESNVDADGKQGTLERENYEPYRLLLDRTPVGTRGAVKVPTGPIIGPWRLDKEGNPVQDTDDEGRPLWLDAAKTQPKYVADPNAGRGRDELKAFRALRTIANQERNLGIEIRHQHLPMNEKGELKTQLRWALRDKRALTDEQEVTREVARKAGLLRRAERNLRKKAAIAARNPNDAKLRASAEKAKVSYERIRKEQEAEKAPAPASKAPAPKAPASR